MKKRIFIVTFAWMLAALLAAGCGNTETPVEEVAAEIEETIEEPEETIEETGAEPEEESDMEEATEESMLEEEEEFVEEEAAEIPPVPETDEGAANFIGGSEMEAEELGLDEVDAYGKALAADEEANGNNNIVTAAAGNVYSDYEMIDFVNADRANYGSASLVWSEYLEKYCRERAVAVMTNMHSKEYADAVARADGSAGMVAHSGAYETENLTYFPTVLYANSLMANENWINSPSHHASRISTEYTQYACAMYYDAATGDAVWVEAFSNGN